MSKVTQIWLIIATFLVIIGLIIFIAVMTVNNWNFTKLNTVKFETNTYQIAEEFNKISIETDTADILFMPSDDDTCKVVCFEAKNTKHSVATQDGTLAINMANNRKWYEYISINLNSPKITVYLPNAEYGALLIKESTGDIKIPKNFSFQSIDISATTGDVKCLASALELIKIKLSTGDIDIENVTAKMFDLSVSTGHVTATSIACQNDFKVSVSTGDAKLTDISCKNIISNGSTGDIYLKNVIANQRFNIKRSTGDVKLEKCDAGELFMITDTGDIKGSLLSDKVFIAQSDTGSVKLPKTVTGGRCEITTDTGNINISIEYIENII